MNKQEKNLVHRKGRDDMFYRERAVELAHNANVTYSLFKGNFK
jgi:hypothetical protein